MNDLVKEDIKERAAMLLAAGKSKAGTAKEIEVSTPTLNNWLKDSSFLDMLDQYRTAATAEYEAAMFGLVEQAISVASDALEQGDRRVALDVLKGRGFLNDKQPKERPLPRPVQSGHSTDVFPYEDERIPF